ncbi:hypothetical protein PIB30_045557 [Stylosanthes scabra]|uniref:Uncharacterized protein n=1 Tax=Stylosanthes scabra TaxID=79078 RepID=A0ABU6VID3_9FABA|nr:hypothetical protein [Stylosanthes scabra]
MNDFKKCMKMVLECMTIQRTSKKVWALNCSGPDLDAEALSSTPRRGDLSRIAPKLRFLLLKLLFSIFPPDDSQQKPVRHCGICSSNSYHTDECPQLQEDNAVASTHNFYYATTNPPYNRQYYTQGGRNNQPACWIPPQ